MVRSHSTLLESKSLAPFEVSNVDVFNCLCDISFFDSEGDLSSHVIEGVGWG